MCMFMCKLFYLLVLDFIHPVLIILPGSFQYILDLGYRDGREIFGEKEEASKEQPECTEIESYLPRAWAIICTPA